MARKLIANLVYQTPPTVFTSLINFRNWIGRSDLTVKYVREPSLWHLSSCDSQIFVHDRSRIPIYRSGVSRRIEYMRSKYFLTQIPFSQGDVLIDCGANIGELGCAVAGVPLKYFAFEPDPQAALACEHNNPAGMVIPAGLWSSDGQVEFFMQPGTADSSIIEPAAYQRKVTIKAVRLDSFCRTQGVRNVRLLKVEAEGAEPEVLLGATGMIKNVHYVAVDAGPERGPSKQSTLVDVANFLYDRRFQLVAENCKKSSFLFVNRDYEI
jgi:FkbM family methyltransferase